MESRINVKVLGSGCAKCKALEEKVRQLAVAHQIVAEIEKVADIQEIMKYGIMMTPGLVIEGAVKSYGTIPKDDQIIAWLKEAAQ
jgi:small redox-active disulfide protein 2